MRETSERDYREQRVKREKNGRERERAKTEGERKESERERMSGFVSLSLLHSPFSFSARKKKKIWT